MKKLLGALTFLLFALPCLAQTPTTPTFTTTSQAAYWLIAGHNEAATDAIGTLKITPNVSVRTDNVVAPNPGAMFNGFGPQYSYVPKNSPWQVYAYGEGGMTNSQNAVHFGASVGGGVNLDIHGSKTFDWNAVEAQWIYGQVSDAGSIATNSIKIATGIKISF